MHHLLILSLTSKSTIWMHFCMSHFTDLFIQSIDNFVFNFYPLFFGLNECIQIIDFNVSERMSEWCIVVSTVFTRVPRFTT